MSFGQYIMSTKGNASDTTDLYRIGYLAGHPRNNDPIRSCELSWEPVDLRFGEVKTEPLVSWPFVMIVFFTVIFFWSKPPGSQTAFSPLKSWVYRWFSGRPKIDLQYTCPFQTHCK